MLQALAPKIEPVRIYDKGVDRPKFIDAIGPFNFLRERSVTIPTVLGQEPRTNECDHFMVPAVVRALPAADGSIRREFRKVSIRQ